MKKSLITLLALVFVLSIAATAMAAANPFVDVPTTSWAYGAINKLVAAGVIDGYGDGTYHGDKAMTRYEAAQMVAKAMAKEDKATADNKALIDKLAVEFATELNNLGVRVAKLEANASSIKFSGDARVRFSEQYLPTNSLWGPPTANFTRPSNDYERFRLNMTSTVNDTTTFNGRIGTLQTGFGSNPTLFLLDANMTTKNIFNTGVSATVGRQDVAIGPSTYFLWTTGMVDAAKINFMVDKASFELGYGDFSLLNNPTASGTYVSTAFDKAYWANFKLPVSPAINFSAGLFNDVAGEAAALDSLIPITTPSGIVLKVEDFGLTVAVTPCVSILGEYWINTANNSVDVNHDQFQTAHPTAYIIRAAYKAVNPKIAGSWGAYFEYYKCEFGATNTNVGDARFPGQGLTDVQTGNIVNFQDNQKAFDLVAQYAIAQNITVDAIQTFNTSNVSTGAAVGNYTRVNINYFF
jgi:hypothetical protein